MEKKMSEFVPLLLLMFAQLTKYGKTAQNILTRKDTLLETLVQFDCLVGSHKGARWKFNETLLFADDNVVSDTFRGSVFLMGNYSLRIISASFRHEGIFSCLKNSTTIAMYDLNILVAPDRLTMTINRQPTSSIVYVPQQEEFVAVCVVIGAKPAANITWLIDNKEADSSRVGPLEKNKNKEVDNLFDSTSRLRYVAKRKQGNITCISKSAPSVPDQHYHATFQTYVQPNMTILVNGLGPLDKVFYVQVGEEVTLTCRVWNAERLKNLTWIIDDSPMNPNFNTWNISAKFEHLSIFRTQFFKVKVNATCFGIGHKANVKVHSGITLFTYAKPKLLFMSKEGNISNDVITVNEHEKFNITCAALGARPPVDLIVKYDDDIELNSEKIINNNSQVDDTFDSFAYVVNFPVKSKVKISCITSGIEDKQDVYRAVDILMVESGKLTVKDNTFIIASAFGGGLLVMVCIIILLCVIHLVVKGTYNEFTD
ncbi:Cell adhesion molecule 4 [Holothuria leucospilota]|uniref:Cell adhesion molecule 4 n=1 Tax=Holothuria leucospilota TaxID=206669 RepID=A0A9Q1CQK1_HOLLE|nr:Cell adhesion molecule 4 [Holothuria leucospilota]